MLVVMARKFRAPRHQFAGTIPGQIQGKLNVRALSADELAALQPHRRDLPEGSKLAPEAETPFGRMYLMGDFNAPGDPAMAWKRHEAGQRYATIVLKYLASIGSPRDTMPGGKGYPCVGDPPHCGHECECLRRKHAYNAAFEALAEAGHRAQVEVSHVAVHGKNRNSLVYLLKGLDALVQHLLTNRR